MHPGLLAFIAGTFTVMGATALLIFLDYHKRSNIHKAVLYTTALVCTVVALVLSPPGLLLVTAGLVPLLLLAYVVLARRR